MKIFYRPEQTAVDAQTFSPSPGKPALVVERWRRLPGMELATFEPVTREDLALAHARGYVDGVLDLCYSNGFGSKDAGIASTLPYTSGSFYAAARHALVERENCVSPTSGFHHAGYDYGSGFCTFNGLMVAAQKLRKEFSRVKVGILDLDCHYGNGTEDIIDTLQLSYVQHYTFGGMPINKTNAQPWLNKLPATIVETFGLCDVVLYQAGADPHVNDPLGGVLTTAQLFERDRVVFQTLKDAGIPAAWNLAGGYQKPIGKVLDLHDNTLAACVAAK